MVLDEYNRTLEQWAQEEQAKAAEARSRNDDRAKSLALMRAGMMGDMLRSLGKAEHLGVRPGILADHVKLFTEEAKRLAQTGDYDDAERTQIKADVVSRALNLLRELEAKA